MNRRDTYMGQLVTEADLDQLLNDAEVADRALMTDLGFSGVMTGLDVAEHAPQNMTVDVSSGTAYDPAGQRIRVPSTQTVNLAVDHASVTTAVVTPGNSKVLSVFAKFTRTLAGPQTDGNGVTVYYDRTESFTLYVSQGAEAVSPTPPALEVDGILLADVTIAQGATTITDSDISTARREDLVVVAGTPHALSSESYLAAITSMLGWINAHFTGGADRHLASAIDYAGGADWAGGTSATNPAVTVEVQLDKIVLDLKALASGASGADRIGCGGIAGSINTIGAGTLFSVLTALKSATVTEYAGSSPTAFRNGDVLPAATVAASITALVQHLGVNGGSLSSGADRVGCYQRTAWLGGRANASSSTWAAIEKIVLDLAVNNDVADDGAVRIGFTASGTIVATNVGAAIRELDTEKAALAGATFTGAVVLDGGASVPSGDTITIDASGTITAAAGSTFNMAGAEARSGALTVSGSGATTANRVSQINAASAAVTLDVTADVHYVETPAGSSTYTIKSTSPAPPANTEMEFVAYDIGINTMTLQREGGQQIVKFVGGDGWGGCKLKFIGGSWRLIAISGAAANFTVANP